MNGDTSQDTLELKDISLSSYLYSTGEVSFVGKRRVANGEVLFRFSPRRRAEELVNSYWNLQAPSIQPKLLFGALRDLKDMIFGG